MQRIEKKGKMLFLINVLVIITAAILIGERLARPDPVPVVPAKPAVAKDNTDKLLYAIDSASVDNALIINEHTDSRADEILARLNLLAVRQQQANASKYRKKHSRKRQSVKRVALCRR